MDTAVTSYQAIKEEGSVGSNCLKRKHSDSKDTIKLELDQLGLLDNSQLAVCLSRYSAAALCSTSQSIRRLLFEKYISNSSKPAHSSAASQILLPIERLLAASVKACRILLRRLTSPTTLLLQPKSNSLEKSKSIVERELQRTLETVVQIGHHLAVLSRFDILPDLLDLIVVVVYDKSGTLLSSDARQCLTCSDATKKLHISSKCSKSKASKSSLPISNSTFPGLSIGKWLYELLDKNALALAVPLSKRTTIILLQLLTVWIQAQLIDASTRTGLISWAISKLKVDPTSLSSNDLLILDPTLKLIYQIARLDLEFEGTRVSQACLDLVVKCTARSTTLTCALTHVYKTSLEVYSVLAERQRPLRQMLQHKKTITMISNLLGSVHLRMEASIWKPHPGLFETSKGLLDLARVLCQLLILCGSSFKWDFDDVNHEAANPDAEPILVEPLNVCAFKAIARILTLIGIVAPGYDQQESFQQQIFYYRPSTIQGLADTMHLLFSSTLAFQEESKANRNAVQILPDEFAEAVIRIIFVVRDHSYIDCHKHAKQQILCQKLIRLSSGMAGTDLYSNTFRHVEITLMRQFVYFIGDTIKNSIMGVQDVSENHHKDNTFQLTNIMLIFLTRLLESKPSRIFLMDAGLLPKLIFMPFIKVALTNPSSEQIRVFTGVLSLIGRLAQDSNFRFKMKAGLFGSIETNDDFSTNTFGQFSVLAPPSPDGIVAFMACLAMGSIWLICSKFTLPNTATPRSILEQFGTYSIDFLNENFGHDKSVMAVLCKPDLLAWISSSVLSATGIDCVCSEPKISMVESLLDLIEYTSEKYQLELLDLNVDDNLDPASFINPTPLGSNTLCSAAYFLDALLRSSATLSQIIKQPHLIRRIAQDIMDAMNSKVQDVLQRITRRLLLGPGLVQEMVASSGYSIILETLMNGLGDDHKSYHAKRLLDSMLGSFLSDIEIVEPSISTQAQISLVKMQTQAELDEALGFCIRIWRYAEQVGMANFAGSILRHRARVAVCYLGADRLLRLHQSTSLSTEDDHFSAKEATTFLWDMFLTVFPSPLLSDASADEVADFSESTIHENYDDDNFKSIQLEANKTLIEDKALLESMHVRMRKALDFLGWRYVRRSIQVSDPTMMLPRPELLIEVLSSDHTWIYNGTADTDRAVTMVFENEIGQDIQFDGDILENVSPAFCVMMNGPFSEHIDRRVKIQDTSRQVWMHILEYFQLNSTAGLDEAEFSQMQQSGGNRYDMSGNVAHHSTTDDMIEKFDLVVEMHDCATRYMMVNLQQECTAWFGIACMYAARRHNWTLAVKLHWWIAAHLDLNLEESSDINFDDILRTVCVRALLWSIQNAP
ncbi:hypothetical protein QVD99_002471 [Batrachochytrium dendrobatidis]|nr:hypothetical protein QVD99_002471 [Batrachochytrium dendrobatidis]